MHFVADCPDTGLEATVGPIQITMRTAAGLNYVQNLGFPSSTC